MTNALDDPSLALCNDLGDYNTQNGNVRCLPMHLPEPEMHCQFCQHTLHLDLPLPTHKTVVYVNLDEAILVLVLVESNIWNAKVARELNIMSRIVSFHAQPILTEIFKSLHNASEGSSNAFVIQVASPRLSLQEEISSRWASIVGWQC
jgi:hypothetical protein